MHPFLNVHIVKRFLDRTKRKSMYRYEELVTVLLLIVSMIVKIGTIVTLYSSQGHTDELRVQTQQTCSAYIYKLY